MDVITHRLPSDILSGGHWTRVWMSHFRNYIRHLHHQRIHVRGVNSAKVAPIHEAHKAFGNSHPSQLPLLCMLTYQRQRAMSFLVNRVLTVWRVSISQLVFPAAHASRGAMEKTNLEKSRFGKQVAGKAQMS